jgi:hypothetical protein
MSRPVRVQGGVAVRVEALAGVERRSFANMVEVLLLEALEGRGVSGVGVGGTKTPPAEPPRPSSASEPAPVSVVSAADAGRVAASLSARGGARPDPKVKGKGGGRSVGAMCEHRVPAGSFCKRCEEEGL